MKFATKPNGSADGELLLVSRNLQFAMKAPGVSSLRELLENWDLAIPSVQLAYDRLNTGQEPQCFPFEPKDLCAPLPRTWQWLDGSAYPNHGYLMARSMGREPQASTLPLMYQGGSDTLLGPCQDVRFPREEDGIDFEAELAVILDQVPLGCTAAEAPGYIRLLMLANDWSLRHVQEWEITTGFGFIQSKPSTSFSPVAVTLDELGPAWSGDRLHLPVHVHVNKKWIGSPNAKGMEPGFGGLIAHAAATRQLSAGTIIGSGTVSEDRQGAGSATLAEVRAIEKINLGVAQTSFLQFGDTVSMEVLDSDGQSVFGAIHQKVLPLR